MAIATTPGEGGEENSDGWSVPSAPQLGGPTHSPHPTVSLAGLYCDLGTVGHKGLTGQ